MNAHAFYVFFFCMKCSGWVLLDALLHSPPHQLQWRWCTSILWKWNFMLPFIFQVLLGTNEKVMILLKLIICGVLYCFESFEYQKPLSTSQQYMNDCLGHFNQFCSLEFINYWSIQTFRQRLWRNSFNSNHLMCCYFAHDTGNCYFLIYYDSKYKTALSFSI